MMFQSLKMPKYPKIIKLHLKQTARTHCCALRSFTALKNIQVATKNTVMSLTEGRICHHAPRKPFKRKRNARYYNQMKLETTCTLKHIYD